MLKMKLLFALIAALMCLAGSIRAATPNPKVRRLPKVFQPIEDVKGLPRVLLVGDSISIGYTFEVRRLLEGKANVHRIPDNGGPTQRGLSDIDKWLAGGKWDVIHFNWGLWDVAYRNPESKAQGHRDKVNGKLTSTPAEYEKNLRTLVARLKKTGAKLIWASTTPVPDGEVGRFKGDAAKYNAIAAKVMSENGVAVDDLYAAALPIQAGTQLPNDVHFKDEGYKVLARHVADSILRALGESTPATKPEKRLPMSGDVFTVDGRTAFLILPKAPDPGRPVPWVWYAPTLPGLPGKAETWMFNQFLENGIAIAGVDVGESYGSPEGVAVYSALYKELTTNRGMAKKACLLARSRGGLMLYNWAVENPNSVACIAGIYPVCNLSSYPGLARARGAYGLTEKQLADKLPKYNPIDRLAPLAKAHVHIFHIHGDKDGTVPLDKNSAELKKRYEALGGKMRLKVMPGQGHNMWPGWFHHQPLVDFIIAYAKAGSSLYGDPAAAKKPSADVMSLAGQWRFALDADNKGVGEKWFARRLDDTIRLPGTTDENHKGVLKDEHCDDRLSRVWYWKGPAWYQRDVTIPAGWKGRHVSLLLERSKNTRVWVDEAFCGWEDTLSGLQIFDVSKAMTPGKHTITVLVDNAKLPPVGPAHAVDERTQTNWNGIIGRIELRAKDPVWLRDVQVYPDVAKRTAVVKAAISNATGKAVEGTLEIAGRSFNTPKTVRFARQSFPVKVEGESGLVEAVFTLGEKAPLWDEFNPALIRLTVNLSAKARGGKPLADARDVSFGLRDFSTSRAQFTINGRPTYLRGKLDCAIFPLTGYPPMDKAGWLRVLGISKAYGVNHYRFHSWCPPEAAFEAADELGMYLQPEFPNKRSGFNAPDDPNAAIHNIDRLDVDTTETEVTLYDYAKRESTLIFKDFGNHPSFVMYTLGNELGRNQAMYDLVAQFKQRDPRHLYAQATNQRHWNPSLAEGDEFFEGTALKDQAGKPLPLRGSYWIGDWVTGHIDNRPPSTMVDYHESIAGVPVPVVAHEMAEFEVAPDFSEIPEYTGVTRARNLEIFRQRLADANMLDQADDFVRASGALSILCHREDIEAELRTPGMGGFHLLDIQDFSGQGTALVGILNAFMESKGLITPARWREFCCEVVPLLRMEKYTWTTDECFVGRVQVAQHRAADLDAAKVDWAVTNAAGRRVAGGSFAPENIKQGNVREVGMFCFPLAKVAAPGKLTITLSIEAAPYRNRYEIWVYPPKVDTKVPAGACVARKLDADAWARLDKGETVLLLPDPNMIDDPDKSVGGAFESDFWCWPMFARGARRQGIEPAPGTQGFICDPNAPALANFPTEFHSNWQWWQLVKHSRPIILDAAPADYRPTVQAIDNFARNHKLGLVFETKAGKGKLLVCSIDLPALQDKPEARQLLSSLLRYAGSKAFDPKAELDPGLLRTLFSPDKASK